jgi:DNA-directed RNA polymerase subunit RPC12/RpoP
MKQKSNRYNTKYICPECKAEFLGIVNRAHHFCTPCQSKRAGELAAKREQEERAASLRAAMLDDIIADETRMPWERKYK